ncbi:MAG TPA: hypothetical protein EYP14_06745 [Planctomycetaceae bacterium]|nr:hypothetical protein [Planctomycetaceae bacterium]
MHKSLGRHKRDRTQHGRYERNKGNYRESYNWGLTEDTYSEWSENDDGSYHWGGRTTNWTSDFESWGKIIHIDAGSYPCKPNNNVELLAFAFQRRIGPGHDDQLAGRHQIDDESGDGLAQFPGEPRSSAEESMVIGAVARGQGAEGGKHTQDDVRSVAKAGPGGQDEKNL